MLITGHLVNNIFFGQGQAIFQFVFWLLVALGTYSQAMWKYAFLSSFGY